MASAEIVLLNSNLLNLSILAIYRSHCFTVDAFNNELQLLLSSNTYKNVVLILI